MPPRNRFTKEEIAAHALNITRAGGKDALTARSLAAAMGSSPRPIFGLFESMDEVQAEVMKAANDLYQSYLQTDMAEGKYPPYKASGMAYIRFAREERELFRLLFMRDRTGETVSDGREELRPILEIIQKNLGLDEEQAYLFHLQQWLYVHGIAVMFATGYLNWDMEFVESAITDMYLGLKARWAQKGEKA